MQVQAAINAVQDHDVLNEEADYIAEGERLLQQRYAAQALPEAAAAAAPQLQQPKPAPPRPAAAAPPAASQASATEVHHMLFNDAQATMSNSAVHCVCVLYASGF